MCGCLTVLLGAFFPRIALILVWIFGDVVQRAFNHEWLLPLVGLILIPYTTLVYVLIYWATGSVAGFAWFFVILAFFVDVSSYASASRVRPQMD